jgi:hypothetical protein
MSTEATPREVGSHAGLGPEPERAAFARWCRENGHGELDDMLTPLDCSLRALMWPVWQGAVAAERERWAAPARAMVAAHDAGMVRLNTAMRAQGVRAITLPAEAADELRAIQALRDLVGPNVGAKLTARQRGSA